MINDFSFVSIQNRIKIKSWPCLERIITSYYFELHVWNRSFLAFYPNVTVAVFRQTLSNRPFFVVLCRKYSSHCSPLYDPRLHGLSTILKTQSQSISNESTWKHNIYSSYGLPGGFLPWSEWSSRREVSDREGASLFLLSEQRETSIFGTGRELLLLRCGHLERISSLISCNLHIKKMVSVD